MSLEAAVLPGVAMRRHELRRLGPLVAVVVAVHALLLAVPWEPVVPQGAAVVAQSVKVRLLESAVPPAPAPAMAPQPGAGGADRDSAEPPRPAATEVVASPEPKARMTPAPAAVLPPAESLLGLSLPGIASEDDLYFARGQLSVAPAPIDAVMIDYPVFAGDTGRYTAELSLFIDEAGRVVRVRVDSAGLPPALEDAARRAFTRARFRPGEAAERGVVKSRIRVEVTFENTLRQAIDR